MTNLKRAVLALSPIGVLMTLSLAGCGGASDASTYGDNGGAQQTPQSCQLQTTCAEKKGGCPMAGACENSQSSCSKGQCSTTVPAACSSTGQCGGCDNGQSAQGCSSPQAGCGSAKECGGCDKSAGACAGSKSEKCDLEQDCLECPKAGECDKLDLTGFADTVAPPLPQSSE